MVIYQIALASIDEHRTLKIDKSVLFIYPGLFLFALHCKLERTNEDGGRVWDGTDLIACGMAFLSGRARDAVGWREGVRRTM